MQLHKAFGFSSLFLISVLFMVTGCSSSGSDTPEIDNTNGQKNNPSESANFGNFVEGNNVALNPEPTLINANGVSIYRSDDSVKYTAIENLPSSGAFVKGSMEIDFRNDASSNPISRNFQ